MNELLRSVISTLDTVEVKGRHNLDALLGCINALETLAAMLEAPPAPPVPGNITEDPGHIGGFEIKEETEVTDG